MIRVGKMLALFGLAACLAIVVAGCGSSSSSTSSTVTGGETATLDTTSKPESTATATTGAAGSKNAGAKKHAGTKSAESGEGSGSGGTNDNGAPLGSDTKKAGDNSIETYGSDVEGAEKDAAVAAMRSFDIAVADRDFNKVCAQLATKIRAGLAESHKPCPELLEYLVVIKPAVARGSANGKVTHVRIGGGNAFVLFRPVGSDQLNYFVMTMEGGKWKALGLSVGTPVNPTAPAPGQ
jgi:hypothetical protein